MPSIEDANKAILHRWYQEVYNQKKLSLMPELAGPEFIRHEPEGTWITSIKEHMKRVKGMFESGKTTAGSRDYELIAEADKVAALGVGYDLHGEVVYYWLQVFRFENGKLVETWFPGYVRGVDWGEILHASYAGHEKESTSAVSRERNKAVLRRWWSEMYAEHRFEAMMSHLAGPEYIRHELTGTWTATIEEHLERIKKLYPTGDTVQRPQISSELIAEGDKVAGYGTMRGYRAGGRDGNDVYSFVQLFRLRAAKIVETWFPGWVKDVAW